MIKAVLFDLDGTFADTAPDLSCALNVMRSARGLPPLPVDVTRAVTSTGARGLLRVGFGMAPDHPDYAAMRAEFLDVYSRGLCVHTQPFPGIPQLVRVLCERRVKWGIVTNKAERLAKALLEGLAPDNCGCVIGGDTTGVTKPRPEPLLAAARLLEVAPAEAIYVGDDERDVEAGRAAGMKTIAVRYGYLNGGDPDAWGADWVVDSPEEVLLCVTSEPA
jgi:phosphoglycolate phosphatase